MKSLKEKWKVNNLQLTLILCIFAIGGSLCGRLGKVILDYCNVERGFLFWVLYAILVTILWPIAVLFVSIFLGQFAFFKNYIKKIGKRMFGRKK